MQEPGGGTENHEQTAQSSGTAVGKLATEKNLELGSPRTPALITAVTSAVVREVGGFRFIYLHLQGADEGGWGWWTPFQAKIFCRNLGRLDYDKTIQQKMA